MNLSLNPIRIKRLFDDGVESDKTYFRFAILFLAFLWVVFNPELAGLYTALLVGDLILYMWDKNIQFSFKKRGIKFTRVFIEAALAYGIFLGISTLIVKTFPQAIASLGTQSTLELLSTVRPALEGSQLLLFIAWAILVPIIEESLFHGRLFEYIRDITQRRIKKTITLKKFDTPTIFVIMIIAAVFTIFHFTAKNLETIPLLITFMFSLIGTILVIKQQQLRGAIIFHMIGNGAVVLSSFGLIPAI